MWRPENWENHYSEKYFREYLPFAKNGTKSPYDKEWWMWDCEIAFEAGADAMLEALKKNGIKIEQTYPSVNPLPFTIAIPFGIHWLVFIPDNEEEK
jgi:hypothetical protein